jgi:hypothetical protein
MGRVTGARRVYRALAALCLLGPQLMQCAHADAPTAASPPAASKKARPLSLHAVTLGHFLSTRSSADQPVTRNADAPAPAAADFKREELFSVTDGTDSESTVQWLTNDQLLQFDLQGNLQLGCELMHYQSPERDYDVGMRIGLRFRF